jgi:integrase
VSTLPREFPASEPSYWKRADGPIPWDQFTAELLELYAPPLRAKGTFNKMRQVLGLVAGLGVTSTAELTPPLVARYVASRPPGESSWTTYSMVSALRAACNYAAAQGYCRVSPFALRKHWVRRSDPGRKRHHSREEIARVLALMKADVGRKGGWPQWRARRLHALASTVAYTGLRKKEALYLRVEDVDFEARMLLVRPRTGNRLKTERSAQPVPIPDALMPVLAGWLPHLTLPEGAPPANAPMPDANPRGVRDAGWVFPNAYRTGPWVGGMVGYRPLDRMKHLGVRAGVEGFTFQSLRHSWATHAEFWGLSDVMIQRVLRHTNTRTQMHYRHADGDNLRAKVGGVGFGHDLAAAEADSAGAASPPTPPTAPDLPPLRNSPGRPMANRPKLDDDDAAEMRRLREAGWALKALATRFGVSKSTVHYTLYGVIHRQAPGEITGPRE